jgi:hypothetical protein
MNLIFDVDQMMRRNEKYLLNDEEYLSDKNFIKYNNPLTVEEKREKLK